MKKSFIPLLFYLVILQNTAAQLRYLFDASASEINIRTGELKMGNPGPAGKEIRVNNYFMSLAGKQIVLVM
ncbi:MAG: hypothetical protein V4592_11210 [Bacteroidota bacterium]